MHPGPTDCENTTGFSYERLEAHRQQQRPPDVRAQHEHGDGLNARGLISTCCHHHRGHLQQGL